jgi:hypothetical protein
MNDARSRIIVALFALVPYALVAWAYMALTNGNANDFWRAFGVLFAVRVFFSIIETLGGVLAWHLYSKRVVVGKHVEFLRAHGFPKRKYSHDDFLAYLVRIEDDPEQPASLRAAAREMHSMLATCEGMGILLGMRMHSASEAALEIYSPKAQAPAYGTSAA